MSWQKEYGLDREEKIIDSMAEVFVDEVEKFAKKKLGDEKYSILKTEESFKKMREEF